MKCFLGDRWEAKSIPNINLVTKSKQNMLPMESTGKHAFAKSRYVLVVHMIGRDMVISFL